ncbi:MAG: hypothetical protein CMJ46_10145 [Planctomyces sp.]|nr:hypothetical protein [Planctomyces sp.]
MMNTRKTFLAAGQNSRRKYIDAKHLRTCSITNGGKKSSPTGRAPDLGTLNKWFGALQQIQRRSAAASGYFEQAVRQICDPGGLEAGRIYLREHGRWNLLAATDDFSYSHVGKERPFLDTLLEERQLCFHPNSLDRNLLKRGTSVVIAPLLDKGGEIIGALWGERRVHTGNRRLGIRQLEARWLQLLSETVSAALIRLEEERRHANTRLLLEQVFPNEVARQLTTHRDLLAGREREVTLLFADLKGSTKVFEQLKPEAAYELMSELMEELTTAAMQEAGVLIDYFGDGLAVMWNAPTDQTEHALAACRAALGMQQAMKQVNERWREKLTFPLRLGIGIHSGPALVGNSGSRQRIKYGPRGQTVVLASRLESATRMLDAGILVSGETVKQLPFWVGLRRLCTIRIPNISEPVTVHELCAPDESDMPADEVAFVRRYETALQLFEQGDHGEACCQLAALEEDPLSERYSVRFLSEHVTAALRPGPRRRHNDKRRDQLSDPAILFELK